MAIRTPRANQENGTAGFYPGSAIAFSFSLLLVFVSVRFLTFIQALP
jgi:hypothetical protein